MAETIKITKREYFEAIRAMVEQIEAVGDIPAEDILTFIDKELKSLDKKKEAAAKRAAKQKAAGDELRDIIKSLLTDEFQNVDALTEQVIMETEDDTITKPKVVARLTQLVKADVAVKQQMKDEESGRKIMFYKLASDEDEVVEEEE